MFYLRLIWQIIILPRIRALNAQHLCRTNIFDTYTVTMSIFMQKITTFVNGNCIATTRSEIFRCRNQSTNTIWNLRIHILNITTNMRIFNWFVYSKNILSEFDANVQRMEQRKTEDQSPDQIRQHHDHHAQMPDCVYVEIPPKTYCGLILFVHYTVKRFHEFLQNEFMLFLGWTHWRTITKHRMQSLYLLLYICRHFGVPIRSHHL